MSDQLREFVEGLTHDGCECEYGELGGEKISTCVGCAARTALADSATEETCPTCSERINLGCELAESLTATAADTPPEPTDEMVEVILKKHDIAPHGYFDEHDTGFHAGVRAALAVVDLEVTDEMIKAALATELEDGPISQDIGFGMMRLILQRAFHIQQKGEG